MVKVRCVLSFVDAGAWSHPTLCPRLIKFLSKRILKVAKL
jgi:hypothetical protein